MRFPALYAWHMHRGPGPPDRMRSTQRRACISPGTGVGRVLQETCFAARMLRRPQAPHGPSQKSPGQVGHTLKRGPLQDHHKGSNPRYFRAPNAGPDLGPHSGPRIGGQKGEGRHRPSHFCPPIPGPNNGPKKGPTLRPQKQSRGAGRRGARHGSEAPGKRRTTLTPPACRHHVLPALDCLTARRTPSLTNPW